MHIKFNQRFIDENFKIEWVFTKIFWPENIKKFKKIVTLNNYLSILVEIPTGKYKVLSSSKMSIFLKPRTD